MLQTIEDQLELARYDLQQAQYVDEVDAAYDRIERLEHVQETLDCQAKGYHYQAEEIIQIDLGINLKRKKGY